MYVDIVDLMLASGFSKESLLEVSVRDGSSSSGYASRSATVETLGNMLFSTVPSAGLSTDNKTILGAINEVLNNSVYHSGETVTFPASNLNGFNGFIATNKKTVILSIPLPKVIPSNLTASITGKVVLRGNSGSVSGGASYDLTGSDVYVVGNGLSIRLTLPTEATNIDANTPVSAMVYPNPVVITFS